jgi:acyl carrier protein
LEPDEQCDLDLSFFDMGLTSLRLTEIKQQLEARLGLAIDPTVMFNRPTLPDLVTYLASLIERDATLAS